MDLFIPQDVATRDLSRNVLARDLAATITDAACAGAAAQWSAWEDAYERASNPAQRADALREPVSMCHDCPAREACADLAELTRYTGIAAGSAYRNGHRLDHRGRRAKPTPS